MTVPEAVKLIAHLVRHHPKMVVGAGTVLNTEMASQCIDAGASFITSPDSIGKLSSLPRKKNSLFCPVP